MTNPDRPKPYVAKKPLDAITANAWNELQIRAREELQEHGKALEQRMVAQTNLEDHSLDVKLRSLDVNELSNTTRLCVTDTLELGGEQARFVIQTDETLVLSQQAKDHLTISNNEIQIDTETVGITGSLKIGGDIEASSEGKTIISGQLIKSNSIKSDKLASDAVTANLEGKKIAVKAITVGDLEVTGLAKVDIPKDSVTEGMIKDGAVTADKIEDNAVTADKIEGGAVTADKIEDGAVTADKIEDGAVTARKIKYEDTWQMYCRDTRSENMKPCQYRGQTFSVEGKFPVEGEHHQSALEYRGGLAQATLLTIRPWVDSTAPYVHQIALGERGSTPHVYHRHGEKNSWKGWGRFLIERDGMVGVEKSMTLGGQAGSKHELKIELGRIRFHEGARTFDLVQEGDQLSVGSGDSDGSRKPIISFTRADEAKIHVPRLTIESLVVNGEIEQKEDALPFWRTFGRVRNEERAATLFNRRDFTFLGWLGPDVEQDIQIIGEKGDVLSLERTCTGTTVTWWKDEKDRKGRLLIKRGKKYGPKLNCWFFCRRACPRSEASYVVALRC